MLKLLDELLLYIDNSTVIIYMSVAAAVLTVVTHFIFRNQNRFMKYLPGIILVIIGIYYLYTVSGTLVENESLAEIMSFVTFVISGLLGMLSALILGVYEKPIKKKSKKKRKESKTVNADQKA